MVASQSAKRAKYTYAERVVGALSRIQREHKKHAVHTATLRAQIRKDAQERKENLGPQWSNWVSRALHKLEEQGVLEPQGAGNFTFTANAKKILTAARRESGVALSLSQAGGSYLEDLAWKQLVQSDLTRGVKRQRRRSSVARRPSSIADDDNGEDDEVTPSTPGRRQSSGAHKRPRRQSIGKSLSRMTKAELQNELQNVQALSHRANPTETLRLQEELAETRRQLNEAREQLSVTPMRSSLRNRSGLRTLESNLLSTPVTRLGSSSRSQRVARFTIPFSNSKSLLDHYSQQPTPAPSSPEMNLHGMDDDNLPPSSPVQRDDALMPRGSATPSPSTPCGNYERDVFQPDLDPFMDDGNIPGSPLTPLQDPATLAPEPEQEITLDDEEGDDIEETNRRLEAQRKLWVAQEESLRTVQARLVFFENLVTELKTSGEDRDLALLEVLKFLNKEDALPSTILPELVSRQQLHDQQLELLRASVQSTQTQLAHAKSHADTASDESARVKARSADLADQNAALESQRRALEDQVEGLRMELKASVTSGSSLAAQIDELQARHADAEEKHRSTHSRIAELNEQLAVLHAELKQVSETSSQAIAARDAATTELATTAEVSTSLRDSLATAMRDLEQHRLAETALTNQVTSLQEAGNADTATINKLRSQSGEFEATINRLQTELKEAADRHGDLTAQVRGHQAHQSELESRRDEALHRIQALEAENASLRLKVTEVQLTTEGLLLEKASAERELAVAYEELEKAGSLNFSLQEQLSSLRAEQTRLKKELAETAEEAKLLHSNVASLQDTEQDLRGKLDEECGRRTAAEGAHAAELTRLQVSLENTEKQANQSAADAAKFKDEHRLTVTRLHEVQTTLDSVRDDLDGANSTISSLTAQLNKISTSVTNAEQEAERLRIALAQNEEAGIQFRQSLALWSEAQEKSLAELRSKIATTQVLQSTLQTVLY